MVTPAASPPSTKRPSASQVLRTRFAPARTDRAHPGSRSANAGASTLQDPISAHGFGYAHVASGVRGVQRASVSLGHPPAYTVDMEATHTSETCHTIACHKFLHANNALLSDQGRVCCQI